jgi:hypothetical protein
MRFQLWYCGVRWVQANLEQGRMDLLAGAPVPVEPDGSEYALPSGYSTSRS